MKVDINLSHSFIFIFKEFKFGYRNPINRKLTGNCFLLVCKQEYHDLSDWTDINIYRLSQPKLIPSFSCWFVQNPFNNSSFLLIERRRLSDLKKDIWLNVAYGIGIRADDTSQGHLLDLTQLICNDKSCSNKWNIIVGIIYFYNVHFLHVS